jgi:hypothetical protein
MCNRKIYAAALCLLTIFACLSCSHSANNPTEAAQILTSQPQWRIDEITVNDAVTFKDGKMTQQFGGIDFQRYMQTVSFKDDGTVEGVFNGETKPFLLKWRPTGKDIAVGSADTTSRGSEWSILPQQVSKEGFIMKTQSTAYDYPRMTKIALKFAPAR